MVLTEKEFQVQLRDAGTKLLEPPASVHELLLLLDKIWISLTKVEQSPNKLMQDALAPSTNALVGDKLIRHSDIDVKASVASCISEITRITAPDAPYDDDLMKEVFQLIVSSFEHLFDQSSPSYIKRTSTLETVAKVRSCVVMLDLECDDLIVEMFHHFLKSIRDYHPPKVFSSMETIMNLVLEESEDITPELLSPILASVKNDNKDVLPIARRLGERVLKCSAIRVGQYLVHALQILGSSVDDYSDIVSSICREVHDNAGHNDETAAEPVADESNAEKSLLEETKDDNQGVQVTAKEPTSPQQTHPVSSSSSKSINANSRTAEENSLADVGLPGKQENMDSCDQDKAENLSRNDEPDDLDVHKVEIAEKNEQNTEMAGSKHSPTKPLAPPESTTPVREKESVKLADSKINNKNISSSSLEVTSVDVAVPKANDKEADVDPASLKEALDESEVISPLPSTENQTGENGSKSEQGNPNEHLVKEVDSTTDVVANKISGETNDPDANQTKRSMKKAPNASSEGIGTPKANQIGENGSESGIQKKKDAANTADVASRKIASEISDPEANQPKQLVKKARTISSEDVKTPTVVQSTKKGIVTNESETKRQRSRRANTGNKSGTASSTKQTNERKRRSLLNTSSKKPSSKVSAKEEDKVLSKSAKSTKDEHGVGETPKTNLKRKRSTGNKKESENKELGEEIVGSKIDVWWPKDKTFYKGVVDSFDPLKKKHKILYDDGDFERLNLTKEKYVLRGDCSDSDKEEESDTSSLNTPSEDVGGGTSRKSKFASSKTSGKARAGRKVVGKSKESNSGQKSKEDVGGKSKDLRFKSASKFKDTDTSKSSNLKIGGLSTPHLSSKSDKDTPRTGKARKETPRTASTSKGKSTKTVGKSDANRKLKSSSSKKTDKEDMDKPTITNTKGKSKAQASKSRTGKKRRRS